MSEHRRVLGRLQQVRGHRDHYVNGRHVYARLPLLQRQDVARAAAAGPARAREHGRGAGEVGVGIHCDDRRRSG